MYENTTDINSVFSGFFRKGCDFPVPPKDLQTSIIFLRWPVFLKLDAAMPETSDFYYYFIIFIRTVYSGN